MPKVVKILEDCCTQVVLLSDNTAILQPKNSCDTKHKPDKNYLKDFIEVGEKSDRTVWLKHPLFTGLKVGTDIPLDFTVPEGKPIVPHIEETVEGLEKHLVELKKQREQLDEPSAVAEPAEKPAETHSEKSSEKPAETHSEKSSEKSSKSEGEP